MKHTSIIVAVGLALAAGLPAAPAAAQVSRTFVSGHGNDANNCSLTAPCRSFAAAFAVTNAGGEIDVLDTAGYGALTINKAISIVNDGSIASVLVTSGGTGITISAGANDAVSLRGLTIEGGGVGTTGIVFTQGASLTIRDCVIRHFTSSGVAFAPTRSDYVPDAAHLEVSNTVMSDNGGDGIYVQPVGAANATAVFDHVKANNNAQQGIGVYGNLSTGHEIVTISDSIAAHNVLSGLDVLANPLIDTEVNVHNFICTHNGTGFSVAGNSVYVVVGHSLVTYNKTGWVIDASGGHLKSFGNNEMYFNGYSVPDPLPLFQLE